MGKKKTGNNKSRKSSRRMLAGFVAGIVVVLSGVYVATKPPVVPVAPATGDLIEIRPVLSPALFTGKVAQAYKVAAEIPKVLDAQFCYCYCKKEKGHKNLLTCFTSRHGSKCETCINEALYAHELYKQGKTIDEIVVAVDRKFYRPYRKSTSSL
ncbi:MAG: hypothetical protein JSU88_09350 [Nitrospinaceae bacterium]|jgi:hypothetical protein|nr:MAG: hypothetical protein JSU88_09350 [Nitrospinaceae bacterium]